MIIPTAKVLIGPVVATAGSETGHVKLDMSGFRIGREFLLTGVTVNNATAPGSTKTLTLKYYWSDVDFTAGAAIATQLADRVTSLTAKTLTNTASVTQYWQFTSSPVRMVARFLMVTYTLSSLDSGATVTLTVNAIALPSTATDI